MITYNDKISIFSPGADVAFITIKHCESADSFRGELPGFQLYYKVRSGRKHISGSMSVCLSVYIYLSICLSLQSVCAYVSQMSLICFRLFDYDVYSLIVKNCQLSRI